MHDADPSKGILFCILANLESVTAVGKAVDSVDSDKDPFCSITFLLLCKLFLPLFFGQFSLLIHVFMRLFSFRNFAVDTGFNGGRILDCFLSQNPHQIALFDFWWWRRLKTKPNLRLLFFQFSHATLSPSLFLFLLSHIHWLWCWLDLLLRRFE